MSAVAGRVLLISKGDYSSATTYNTLDWVRYNNAAWICKEDNVQNEPPSLSSTKWALMAADSAMSNLGDLNDVSISSEVAGQFLGCVIDTTQTPPVVTWENVFADQIYNSTGTKPISGKGVSGALLNYYTKSEIPLPDMLKYGGTKGSTWLSNSDNLVAANAGYVYMSSGDYMSTSSYLQGSHHYIPTGSLVAVLHTNNSYYFCIINRPDDEWGTFNNQLQTYTENSSTGVKTITFYNVLSTDVIQLYADTADGRVVKFSQPQYNSQDNSYSFKANVTILPTTFYLRKIR